MKWLLIIWFLHNGQWIPGDMVEGWGSIPQPSKEECLVKLKKAFEINKENVEIRFTCKEM